MGRVETDMRVELVLWDLARLEGRPLTLIDGCAALPMYSWQMKKLFAMRKFNFGGDSKDVIVLPDAGVSFAKDTTGVPVPADVLRLRNMWKLAADGKGRELLGDEDCELCAQMGLLEEKEKTGSDMPLAVPPGLPGETEATEARKAMGGRLTEPVATCPHCMLRSHEKCARRILLHRMRMVAAATAMQGDGGAGALPDPLSVPELQSAVLEMRPFGRNVVCALCRQGCARIGASGSRNARSSSLGGTI